MTDPARAGGKYLKGLGSGGLADRDDTPVDAHEFLGLAPPPVGAEERGIADVAAAVLDDGGAAIVDPESASSIERIATPSLLLSDAVYARQLAFETLSQRFGEDRGYDPSASEEARRALRERVLQEPSMVGRVVGEDGRHAG